jgi:hypothetical protein
MILEGQAGSATPVVPAVADCLVCPVAGQAGCDALAVVRRRDEPAPSYKECRRIGFIDFREKLSVKNSDLLSVNECLAGC